MQNKIPIELLLLTGTAETQAATSTTAAAPSGDTPEPKASASPEPGERNTEYRAKEGDGVTQSGAMLMTEAYAAIWILVFVMIVRSMRKQAKLDQRIDELRKDIAAALKKDAGDDDSG